MPEVDRGKWGNRGDAFVGNGLWSPGSGGSRWPSGTTAGRPAGQCPSRAAQAEWAEAPESPVNEVVAPDAPVVPVPANAAVPHLDDLKEAVEERAAIREHEGGLPRALAEDMAFLDVCRAWRLGCRSGRGDCDRILDWQLAPHPEPSALTPRGTTRADDEFVNWVLNTPVTTSKATPEVSRLEL